MSKRPWSITPVIKVIVCCKNCGKEKEFRPLQIAQGFGKYCNRLCYQEYMTFLSKQKKHPNFKGGIIVDKRGYIRIRNTEHPYSRNGYVREHRLVMEKQLGRYLEPTEIVHHINGNIRDNRIENLLLCDSQKEHVLLESKNGTYKNTHINQKRNSKGVFTKC